MNSITILLLHMRHGGIEKQTISLANELSRKYKVNIISTYSMNNQPAYEVNPEISVKYLIDSAPNRNEFKNAIKSKNILNVLKEGFKAVRLLHLKRSLMIKEIKKLDTDYVLSTRIEFADMLSKFAPKNVVTLTQEHLHNDSKKYIKNVKKSFRNLNYLVVLCDGSRENYSKWLENNKKIKIVQIPNILEDIPESSSALESNNLVAVGRLHPVKNFASLIEVFASVNKQIPSSTLSIAGDGEEKEYLESLVKKLGLEQKVHFKGMLSKEEVTALMLSSDLYVMTSLTECFPMVLLEAQSCGLPLVSFDVPVGPKAIINNGFNGYLVPFENKDEMAERIILLLENRKKLLDFSKNAKQEANKYLPHTVMKLWYQIFDN